MLAQRYIGRLFGISMQLKQPYMGMWIATHSELLRLIQHDFWDKAKSLQAHVPELGYPERSNGEILSFSLMQPLHA